MKSPSCNTKTYEDDASPQALLDTTTGGYFLKDIASGDAFNEGLPPEAESYFSVLFDSGADQKFIIKINYIE
mgnify:CR=1 FL=1